MSQDYSFQLPLMKGMGQEIIYEEPNHKLVIWFDISGVPQFDLTGCDTSFQKWTEPAGEPISKEKQEEILKRFFHWARTEKHLRLDIGPGVDMDTIFAQDKREGFKVERRPDGTVVVSHPKRKT